MSSTVMYVHDKLTNTRFLVDSGADVSLLPATAADRAHRGQALPLAAANGSPIQSYGKKTVQLQLCDKQFAADFIIADVPAAILGADFLRSHKLLVDLGNRCLIDTRDYAVLPCTLAAQHHQRVSVVDMSPCQYKQLLLDRPALITPPSGPRHPPTACSCTFLRRARRCTPLPAV